jgi:hypothetical protein
MRVPAEGGKPELVTKIGDSESGHLWPQFLPDGRHYLYTVWAGQAAASAIVAGALDAPAQKTRVLAVGSNPGYADPGYLLFHREGAVYAQPFNASTLAVSGDPVQVADAVTFDASTGLGHFSVARSGTLAYNFSANTNVGAGTLQAELGTWQLSWVDRASAQVVDSVGSPGVYRGFNVSPDTKRVTMPTAATSSCSSREGRTRASRSMRRSTTRCRSGRLTARRSCSRRGGTTSGVCT